VLAPGAAAVRGREALHKGCVVPAQQLIQGWRDGLQPAAACMLGMRLCSCGVMRNNHQQNAASCASQHFTARCLPPV
jgi:hypothetical protein